MRVGRRSCYLTPLPPHWTREVESNLARLINHEKIATRIYDPKNFKSSALVFCAFLDLKLFYLLRNIQKWFPLEFCVCGALLRQ